MIDFKVLSLHLNLTPHLSHMPFFFAQSILINQFCQIVGQGLTSNFYCFKQPNSHLFRLPITSQGVNHKSQNIMCFLDMHKSKLVVANIQSTNFGKTYICFVFSTNLIYKSNSGVCMSICVGNAQKIFPVIARSPKIFHLNTLNMAFLTVSVFGHLEFACTGGFTKTQTWNF